MFQIFVLGADRTAQPLPSGAPILGSILRSRQRSTEIFYQPASLGATYAAYVGAASVTGGSIDAARFGALIA
jgi:hypothetical protein